VNWLLISSLLLLPFNVLQKLLHQMMDLAGQANHRSQRTEEILAYTELEEPRLLQLEATTKGASLRIWLA